MVDLRTISYEDTQDPQGVLPGPEEYQKYTRDPVRTPMQWDSSPNAGFSSTDGKTWLPVHPNFTEHNLELQKAAERSHYHVYTQLVELREHPAIRSNNYESTVLNDDQVFAYKRSHPTQGTIYVAINFADSDQTISLKELGNRAESGIVRAVNHQSAHREGYVFEFVSKLF